MQRARGVPPPIAVRVLFDVCGELHTAHERVDDDGQPVIHRNVNPENIVVGPDGVARMTDFGGAKSLESATHPTAEGSLKGKIAHMAPEYADGRPMDRRADVFGLGVVLWEALAGKWLFTGDSEGEVRA